MLADCPVGLLVVFTQHQMRLDSHAPLGESAVAGGAVLLVVAAIALLLIVQGFQRVNADEVAAVAFGLEVTPEVFHGQVVTAAASLMAIQAPFLLMALLAVAAGLAGQYAVAAHEVSIMVRSYPLALMAGVTLLDLHFGVFLVRHLFSVRLLLEVHQGTSKHCYYQTELFH